MIVVKTYYLVRIYLLLVYRCLQCPTKDFSYQHFQSCHSCQFNGEPNVFEDFIDCFIIVWAFGAEMLPSIYPAQGFDGIFGDRMFPTACRMNSREKNHIYLHLYVP